MRRVLAVLGACALLFGSVGGAAANAPFKESDHSFDAGCSNVATALGTAEFGGYVSDIYGADAWLDVWKGEPYADDPVLTRDWDVPASVSVSAGVITMTIPLLPSGTATFAGTLTPADTFTNDDRFRDGNSWYRSTASGTSFVVEGTLTLPGLKSPVAVGPDGCGGSETAVDTFVTMPHAYVNSFTGTGGVCDVENADGGTGTVFFGMEDDILSVDGSASGGGSEIGFYGAGLVAADGTATFTTDEYDNQTGADLPTDGSVDATLVDTGETFSYTLRGSNGFARTSGSLIDVGGELVTSVGTFSLEACVITETRTKRVDAPSSGPKPGGKVPVNDLPSGAVALKPGSRTTVATKGAQMPSEVDYPCLIFTDPFDGTTFTIPVEYTVWYKIAGTGEPIIVDTAGSDFDTVLAVYAGAPNAAATVACVDDTPLQPVGRTLQAAATFDTVAGTTYWVQAGGLDEDVFGPDNWVPYGTLKVAVR